MVTQPQLISIILMQLDLDLQNQIAASTITSPGIGATATGDDEAIMDKTDGETQSKVMRR